jgi:hypothetical protein
VIFIPLRRHIRQSFLINLLIPSSTMRKRKGDRGHPCRRYLEEGKKEDREPIRTTKEVDSMHPII